MSRLTHLIATAATAFSMGAQAQAPQTQELQRVEITGSSQPPLVLKCEPGMVSTLPIEDNSVMRRLGVKVCLDDVNFETVFPSERSRLRRANQLMTGFMELVGKAEMGAPAQGGELTNVSNLFVSDRPDGTYAFIWTVQRPVAEVNDNNRLPGDEVRGEKVISTISGNFGRPRLDTGLR